MISDSQIEAMFEKYWTAAYSAPRNANERQTLADMKDCFTAAIKLLTQILQKQSEAIRFYAKEGNWDDRVLLILSDAEDTAWSSYNGGKRARQAQREVEELIKKMGAQE